MDDVELPALLGLAFGPELPVTDDGPVLEDVVASVDSLGRALPVPFERGVLLGPPFLELGTQQIKLLNVRLPANALLALKLEDGVLKEKLMDSLLELLVLRPEPEQLRMVHSLEAERVSSHRLASQRLPVNNPLLRGFGLWSFRLKLIVYTVSLPLLLGRDRFRFLQALQLL